MNRIDRWFIAASFLFAFAGMLFGIVMGAREDFSFAPVHAHINLIGFVTNAIYGIGYQQGWAEKNRLAVLHFCVAVLGAVLFPFGIYLSATTGKPAVVIVGSLLTLTSLLLFTGNLIRTWTRPAAQ